MMTHLPHLVALVVFVAGLYGIVTSRNFVHLVLCVGVLQSSTYVLLVAIGLREGAPAPVYVDGVQPGTPTVDPVVQAIMLTDIVVEATVMALLLALVVQLHKRRGTLDPSRAREMRG